MFAKTFLNFPCMPWSSQEIFAVDMLTALKLTLIL